MPPVLKKLMLGLALLCCTVLPSPAYNPPGHLESVRLMLLNPLGPFKGLSSADRSVVAACAQLPDMSRELDATQTYVRAALHHPLDWAAWAAFGSVGNNELRSMFAVQHLLHLLTGGNAAQAHAVALASMRKFVDTLQNPPPETQRKTDRIIDLCALGFSLHLWGDAWAHTEMPWNDDDPATHTAANELMYPTGRGHGLSDAHFPDFVLCSRFIKAGNAPTPCEQDLAIDPKGRFSIWNDYWLLTGQILGSQAPLISDSNRIQALPQADVQPENLLLAEIRGIGSPADAQGKLPEERRNACAASSAAAGLSLDQPVFSSFRGGNAPLDQLDASCNDVMVGVRLQSFVRSKVKAPKDADGLDDTAAAGTDAAEFREALHKVEKLGLTDRSGSCNEVLKIILKIAAQDKDLPTDSAKETCAAVWLAYYPVVMGAMVNCIKKSTHECQDASLPVDKSWTDTYASGTNNSCSPMDGYAAAVALNLAATQDSEAASNAARTTLQAQGLPPKCPAPD